MSFPYQKRLLRNVNLTNQSKNFVKNWVLALNHPLKQPTSHFKSLLYPFLALSWSNWSVGFFWTATFSCPLIEIHVFCVISRKCKSAPVRINNLPNKPDFSRHLHPYYCFIVTVVNSWLHYSAQLHTIFCRKYSSPHYTSCKSAEGCPYPNLLNLVSFNELDCTDQESTCINRLTSHSTKMHRSQNKMVHITWCTVYQWFNPISINWSIWKLWCVVWKTVYNVQ